MSTQRPPIALLTGGGRGIGRAILDELVRRGWRVGFTYRNDRTAAEAAEAVHGGAVRSFELDLADRARPATLVAEVEDALGPVDALVNNAGGQVGALAAMTSDDVWDGMLETHLGGAFRLSRVVLRGMARRRGGAIVNVASLAALRSVPGLGAYSAAKAGLLSLTRTLAREMGGRGIRVNAVVLGFVATELTASLPADAERRLRAGECLPNGTTAADAARAVAFLLSEDAAAITGAGLVVDAGASI